MEMEMDKLFWLFYYDVDHYIENDDNSYNDHGFVIAENMAIAFNKIKEDFGEDGIIRVNKLECVDGYDLTNTISLWDILDQLAESGYVPAEMKVDNGITENMEAEIDEMREGDQFLRDYIAKLEKEVEHLEKRLALYDEQRLFYCNSYRDSEVEVDNLKKENKFLASENKDYRAEYSEVCMTVDELRYDLNVAYTELGKKDEEVRKLKAEIERLENRLDYCDEQRKDFGDTCNELEIKVDSLNQKNARLNLENISLKEEIKSHEKEKKDLSAAIDRLSEEKQELKDHIADLEYEIDHYLPDEMVSKDEYDIMMKELANLQGHCDKLEIENETISRNYEILEDELACTEDDLCEARDEITRLEEKIDTLKKDNDEFESKLIAIEGERNEAKDWNAVLNKELDELTDIYEEVSAEVRDLREINKEYKVRVKELDHECECRFKYAEGLEAELETRKRHERQLSKELADEKQKAFGKAVPCGTWNVKFEEGDSNDGT